MNRAQLKAAAKTQIKGKIGILFVITLIIGLTSFIAGLILALIPGGGLVASIIITPAFSLSLIRVYLNVINLRQEMLLVVLMIFGQHLK